MANDILDVIARNLYKNDDVVPMYFEDKRDIIKYVPSEFAAGLATYSPVEVANAGDCKTAVFSDCFCHSSSSCTRSVPSGSTE